MSNYASSALYGAGTGALAGSAAGPVGALVGAGVGTLAGLFSAYQQEEDAERKREILEDIKRQYKLEQNEIESLMASYYDNPENFLGTRQDVEDYRKAVSKYDPNAFVHDFDEFKYVDENGREKTVDDFVNPYYDKIIDATSKKVQHSAAGAGVGRGTGAANAIAEAVAQKDDELYKTALGEYNADRSRAYSEWSGNIQAMQNKLNQLKAATDSKLNMTGNLANDYTSQKQQQMQDEIAAKQNRSQGNLSLASMGLMI